MRVLVVEDNPRLANAVCRGLREEGYAVDHAPAGEEARLLTAAHRYDVIILDRLLPEVSGDLLLAG